MTDPGAIPSLQELYPHLDGEALKDARTHLDEYVALALRIYDRIREDPDAYAEFRRLTGREGGATGKANVDPT